MNLHSKHLKTLQTLFSKHPAITQALLFGSRALGTHKESSDIDIALKGDITPTLLAHLKEELEDSTLPYFCDILDYERAPQELKEHIDTHALSLYKREEEWQEVRLGDVATRITSGGTPPTTDEKNYNGEIPWLNTKEVKNCRIYKTEKTISDLGLKNSSAKWIEKDSVIVAMYGATAGKVAINKIPLTTNQACCNITINPFKADYRFVYYSLLNQYERLTALASGAAQQNLNVSTISNLTIPLPPLERQKEIAEILSSFDDKIDFLHRQNRTLESLAQTLFRHYFIDNAKEEWEEKPFSELVAITSGKALPKGSFDENGQYEVLGANGCIGRSNEYNHDSKLIYTGRVGTLGKIFSINPAQKVWLSDNTLIIHPKEYFFYIFYLMQTFKLENLNAGSTQPLLRQGDLKNIQVKIPPKGILTIFEEYVNILQNKKSRNETKIFSLELFKKQVASFYL